jgi:hypothetical protein
MILGFRADIVVKYIYAATKLNLISTVNNDEAEELYKKHIIIRTGGKEPDQQYKKGSVDDYLRLFNDLISSILNNGYIAGKEVQISTQNNLPLSGAHRIATSLALGRKLPVVYSDLPGFAWDINWFIDSGFQQKEINLLLRTIFNLKPKRFFISILWCPVESHWAEIENDLNQDMTVIYSRTLNFDDEAFQELVLDVYSFEIGLNESDSIRRKINLLKNYPSKLRVIFCESKFEIVHSKINALKKTIREKFKATSPVNFFTTLHIGASELENLHLLNIFANENNLLYLSKRKTVDSKFLGMLKEFIEIIKEHKINVSDCCVVGGGALNALGIRMAEDIDFTVSENVRFSKFNLGITKFSPRVDLVSFNYPRTFSQYNSLTDSQLISNPDNHFLVRGIKFANPIIILTRKQHQRREKDLKDLKPIAEFLNCISSYNK